MGRVCLRPGVAAGCAAVTACGPAAQGRCISLLPAVSAVSALFIAAAVSSHRRKGPVFSPHLGRTRGVRPPFLPGGIVCPAQKKDARGRLFFCDCPQVLLSVLPHTARKGECEGETFAGFPTRVQSSARRRPLLRSKSAAPKKKDTHVGVFLFWSGRRGSNSLPRPWQGRALPDELRPRMAPVFQHHGASGRSRTNDTRIFSPLPYQLSYRGKWRPRWGSNPRPPA